MQATAIRFGLFGAFVLIVINLFTEAVLGSDPENFQIGEVIGYAAIVLSMSLIYFSIRRCRDRIYGGAIGFGRAIVVGLATDLVASVLYGAFMIYYFKSWSPQFLGEYLEYYRGRIRDSGLPAEEIARQLSDLDGSVDFLLDPYLQAGVMFATVFVIGAFISLVSALLVRRRRA